METDVRKYQASEVHGVQMFTYTDENTFKGEDASVWEKSVSKER